MDEARKKPSALSTPPGTLSTHVPSNHDWQPPGPILAGCWLSCLACLSHGFMMEIMGRFQASLGEEKGHANRESELSVAPPLALLPTIRRFCCFLLQMRLFFLSFHRRSLGWSPCLLFLVPSVRHTAARLMSIQFYFYHINPVSFFLNNFFFFFWCTVGFQCQVNFYCTGK